MIALLGDPTVERKAIVWPMIASIPVIPLATASVYAGVRDEPVSASWNRFARTLSRIAVLMGIVLSAIALIKMANVIGELLPVAVGVPSGYVGPGWQARHIFDAATSWMVAAYSGMAAVIALASGRWCLRLTSLRPTTEAGVSARGAR